MRLDPATVLALAATCAAHVAPDTMLAVARVESGLDPLVIGVNGAAPHRFAPASAAAAASLAARLIASGQNIDLGLAQINVRNLAPLGLSIADAFDPCRNLAASAMVLHAGWARASAFPTTPVAALRATLSLYNTGTPGSITTIHADSATLAFEQLTLLVKESEGGRDLERDDIRAMLRLLVDVVVQMQRVDGAFRVTEVWHEPLRQRALAA